MFEEMKSLFHRHIQHIINTFPLIFDLQRLPVVPLSLADLTGYIHIRKKMHLNLQDSVAAAGLAPAAFHIKTETSLLISPCLCIRRSCEQFPDQVKHSRICGRVGLWRPADRRLVNIDHLVQLLDSFDVLVLSWYGPGTV